MGRLGALLLLALASCLTSKPRTIPQAQRQAAIKRAKSYYTPAVFKHRR